MPIELDSIKEIWKSESGLMCLVRRLELGEYYPGHYYAGYVVVPVGHPFYKVHYYCNDCWKDDHDTSCCMRCQIEGLDVHGGVTFADFINEDWCIGFDCAHSFDMHDPKDLDYVKAECEKLAVQVKERA